MDGFAVGLDTMDAGVADVNFACRGGIAKVVDVGPFQYQCPVVNRIKASKVDKWCFHIDNDLFPDEIFHGRIPALNTVLSFVSDLKNRFLSGTSYFYTLFREDQSVGNSSLYFQQTSTELQTISGRNNVYCFSFTEESR